MSRLPVSEAFQTVQSQHLPSPGCKTYLMSECPVCNDTFKNELGVSIHAGRKHPDKKDVWSSVKDKSCEVCGDIFETYPSVDLKTCSMECANVIRSEATSGKNSPRYNSKEIECQNCGNEFTRWPSQIEKYDDHFCSKDCHNEWRTGNEAAYVPKRGYITSELIDHSVRSGWELGVAEMLVENGIDYQYEPKKFEVDGVGYVPDFIIGSTVVEVKGWKTSDKTEKFAMQQSKYDVVVIGADIDVDERFPYENKEELLEVLE